MDEHLLRFDKKKTYAFIDCETENLCLHHFHNLPWQIGMIKVKGEKIIANEDLWVEWDREINLSEMAARITKFDKGKYDSLKKPYNELFEKISVLSYCFRSARTYSNRLTIRSTTADNTFFNGT